MTTLLYQKAPFTIHKLDLISDFSKKYAPKFVNQLLILNKDRLHFRTKYLKKVSNLICQPSWFDPYDYTEMKSILLKIAKRFKKSCKGEVNLDPKILSSFSSLKKCHLSDISSFPLYFKIGNFPKLLLSFQTLPAKRSFPRNPSEISQHMSKMVAKIKRSKHLKGLKIEFDEKTLDILTPLLLQFEKHPLFLSSLSNFTLDYQSWKRDDHRRLSNSLACLKDVTHLSLKTNIYEAVKVNLYEFTRLSYLDVDLEYYDKAFPKNMISLEALTNLETFKFKVSIGTLDQIEDLLMNFRPPKYIKTLSLALTIQWSKFLPLANTTPEKTFFSKLIENISFLKPKGQNQFENFFEEEWGPAKEFYERWSHLHKLSHLKLDFSGSPNTDDDINFFFIAPIIKGCHHLKSLVLLMYCRSIPAKHQGLFQWSQLLQTLGSSKDLEDLKLLIYHAIFDQKSSFNFLIFKNLKTLNLKSQMIGTKDISFIHTTLPKTLKNVQFSYHLIISNEKEIQEFFAILKTIPKYFQVHFDISLSGQSPHIFQGELLDYISSTRIEGQIIINIHERGFLNIQQLKDSLAKKTMQLAPTGSLKIINVSCVTIFKSKKTDIFYCID